MPPFIAILLLSTIFPGTAALVVIAYYLHRHHHQVWNVLILLPFDSYPQPLDPEMATAATPNGSGLLSPLPAVSAGSPRSFEYGRTKFAQDADLRSTQATAGSDDSNIVDMEAASAT